MITHERVIQWMNVVREEMNSPEQYRVLENFWESQLRSKMWLIEQVNTHCLLFPGSHIYIFGGWYGVLGQLLYEAIPGVRVTSVDKDAKCMIFGERLKLPDDDIEFITADMQHFTEYSPDTRLVINTSTEHVSQDTFDAWLSHVPHNVNVVLQGNNFFSCEEHVRCAPSLDAFQQINKLDVVKFAGHLDCTQFTRYMTIGYKL
jgi:hypothetical protein